MADQVARLRAWFDACAEPGLQLLERLGGPRANDPRARQLLLAIALQESATKHRAQVLMNGEPGPARGWWQFERPGGVAGVLTHPATATLAARLCERLYVQALPFHVWRCLEGHDALAAAFARLLLYSDPAPLPVLDDATASYQYYLRNWRPGKFCFGSWQAHWTHAAAALGH